MTQQEFISKMNSLAPTEIVNMPEVKAKYTTIYASIWKDRRDSEENAKAEAEAVYNRESRYFNTILSGLLSQSKNPQLMAQQMDRFSIYNSFLESAITNLTLEPGTRALAYLTTRNYKAGVDQTGRDVWAARLQFTVSGYGEMVARIRCGQIRHADNPVVVYANDELTVRDTDGRKSIEYVCHFPHTNQPIVACYMRITRADGSVDYAAMYEEDWKRLEGYSAKQNKNGGANALYNSNGQIDPGFLQAKLIKHAFKTYPKVKIGETAIMSEEDDDARNILQHDEAYQHTPWQDAAQNAAPAAPAFAMESQAPAPETQEHAAPTYQAEVKSVAGGVQVQSFDDIF